MSYATPKAERLIQAIYDELITKYPAWTVAKLYNGSNDVYLSITVDGTNISFIKIVAQPAPASGVSDGLGLTQTVYTPHIIRFGYDTTTAFGVNGFAMLAACFNRGTKVEFYQSATIAEADLSGEGSGAWFASWRNLEWGLLAQV